MLRESIIKVINTDFIRSYYIRQSFHRYIYLSLSIYICITLSIYIKKNKRHFLHTDYTGDLGVVI
jgi:hypothetical protein